MAFAKPHDLLHFLNLTSNSIVADFGTGSGTWALAIAHVLTDGTLYAIDIQKDLLDRLKIEADKQHLTNIKYIWGDIETRGGVKIIDASVDLVLIANVLFQSKAHYSIALEAKRILKPHGRVCIVDWSDSFGGLGPQPADVVSSQMVRDAFAQAGFVEESNFNAGDHHYGMILKKTSL